MFDKALINSKKFVLSKNLEYKRYFIKKYALNHRLTIIKGARGIGKTVTIAQYMAGYKDDTALYISLDDVNYKSDISILKIAEEFSLYGGKLLCLDEIHKYANWSGELKNIYDTLPDLKILVSGSSAMDIYKGSHDLSRRALIYDMAGMSFREFLELHCKFVFSCYTLEEILENHIKIAENIISKLDEKDKKILPLFKDYLSFGYYPYYLEMSDIDAFKMTINQSIKTSIENDLLNIYPDLTGNSIRKIERLLSAIMKNVPFKPNMTELKKIIDIKDDRTLKDYLFYLDESGIIKLLMAGKDAVKNLDKPEKIYMANSNLINITDNNTGTARETFFFNQLDNYYLINNKNYGIYNSKHGDFICEEKYIFEIGGGNKKFNQIKDVKNSYLALDNLEIGSRNKIPIWLFGFLY